MTPSVVSTDPRERRRLIDGCVRELHERFSQEELIQSFSTSTGTPSLTYTDPILDVQTIARVIASHLQLDVCDVIVSFRSGLPFAAQVELSDDDVFFVEIDSRYRNVPTILAGHLAHEVTHIFLYRANIQHLEMWRNEILTDTTAVYLGLGAVILNAHTETYDIGKHGEIMMTKHGLGYLTLPEFGYVLAERAYRFGDSPAQLISSRRGYKAYRRGRKVIRARLRKPPYAGAAKWRRAVFSRELAMARNRLGMIGRDESDSQDPVHARGYSFALDGDLKVRFRCVACNRGLQITTASSDLKVSCPTCGAVHKCRI